MTTALKLISGIFLLAIIVSMILQLLDQQCTEKFNLFLFIQMTTALQLIAGIAGNRCVVKSRFET